jgi:hypothetical protein
MPTESLLAVYQELRSDWSAREPVASTMGTLGRAAWSEWAIEGDTFGLELPYPTWAKTVTVDLVKVGPKGYIHGWIKVGPSAVGDLVHHPEHGHGKVTRVGSKTVGVQFHSGAYHAFEHGGTGEGHFVERAGRAAKPAAASAPQEDVVGRVAQELGMGQGHAYSPDAKALIFARGELADGATLTEAADRLERFILGPDGNSYLHHNVPSEERDAARQQWRDFAGRLRQADVPGRAAKPATPKRQPLPGLRMNKLEHGDHVVWESPGEAPVHGTVRREGKGKRTYIDWDNGRSEPVSRAGREPNMRMATDEERAERAAAGENPNDQATRLAMHAEGSTLDPAVYRRALVAPITEVAAAMATDAHNGASPRAVAHRVRTAHNRHRDIVDRMGWAGRLDDIAATAESGDVAGAQQKMGDLAAAADVRLGAMPGDVVPFGDEHEPLGEIGAGAPAQVHRPATYFTASGREYLHERGQAMPAPTVSTTIPVDQLKHGDYAEVVGEDQYGKPITLRGYVSQPTGVRIGTRGRKKRDAVAVQVTETPGGANGWRGVAYVAPGTHVTPVPAPVAAPVSPRMQAEALRVQAAARQRALDAGLPATGSTSRPHHVPAGPVGTGRGATAAGWLQRIAEQQQIDELHNRAEQVAATPVSAPQVTRAAEDRIIAMDRPGAPAHIRETAAGIRERRAAEEASARRQRRTTFRELGGNGVGWHTNAGQGADSHATQRYESGENPWDIAAGVRSSADRLESRGHSSNLTDYDIASTLRYDQNSRDSMARSDSSRLRSLADSIDQHAGPAPSYDELNRLRSEYRRGRISRLREALTGNPDDPNRGYKEGLLADLVAEENANAPAQPRTRITVAPRGGRMPAALKPPPTPRPAVAPKPPKLPPAEAAQQALNHIRAGGQTEGTLKALPVAALRELARLHGIVGSLGGRDNVKRMRKPDLIREMTPWLS